MPFARSSIVGHLQELRRCLLYAMAALMVCASVAFYFSGSLMGQLARSLQIPLVFLSPEEALWSHIKLSLFVGLLASFPMMGYALWRFVAPGLLETERHRVFPFLFAASVFFLIGVATCYFWVLPFALDFLIRYGKQQGLVAQISVARYVDFNIQFLVAFGLIFEIPVVMWLLSQFGWLTYAHLKGTRRYAILSAFFIAAVITPTPDVFNQTLTAVPLWLLYEIGILAVRFSERRSSHETV